MYFTALVWGGGGQKHSTAPGWGWVLGWGWGEGQGRTGVGAEWGGGSRRQAGNGRVCQRAGSDGCRNVRGRCKGMPPCNENTHPHTRPPPPPLPSPCPPQGSLSQLSRASVTRALLALSVEFMERRKLPGGREGGRARVGAGCEWGQQARGGRRGWWWGGVGWVGACRRIYARAPHRAAPWPLTSPSTR